jgi:hypothetical protein
MTVRVLFRCSRCGSKFFRRSWRRTFKDIVLEKIGVVPQRCLGCHRRFYLYRPVIFELLRKALLRPSERPAITVSPEVRWNALAETDCREGHPLDG